MDLDKAIVERRSIRKFKKEKVEREKIFQIIEAGMWAPSACNAQGWKFIVVDDTDILRMLHKNNGTPFLRMINQAILVVYDMSLEQVLEKDRQNYMQAAEYRGGIQSASACIQNMLLKAYSMDVGTCWINLLPEKKIVREIFAIPESYEIVGLVALGYYEQKNVEMPRKHKLDEVVCFNKFSV